MHLPITAQYAFKWPHRQLIVFGHGYKFCVLYLVPAASFIGISINQQAGNVWKVSLQFSLKVSGEWWVEINGVAEIARWIDGVFGNVLID